ncbi:hypothetical protein GIB67_011137 [Kingdonia uniflora]|uniref:G domain-containing protein n=1 Tax=Kingdonia uniflora TaxID=39325 RepID=A0A7J7PAZ8_9MAGN|nr:hypothetical protein GIB67_011137 [Kingdonia uniflora]
MLLTNLPRLSSPLLPLSSPSLLYSKTLFLLHKTTLTSPQSISSSQLSSILTISEDTKFETPHFLPILEEPHAEIPLEKFFVPPDTDVSGGAEFLNTRVLRGSNIVLSRYASGAQISQAEFVKSSTRTDDCPGDGLPEFALVGRSNVGKSSLHNSIVRRKKLALPSKKLGNNETDTGVGVRHGYRVSEKEKNVKYPERQCINHFRINDSRHLVYLPRYGPKTNAPSRSRPSNPVEDIMYIEFEKCNLANGRLRIPMTLIFTKCDKRKKKRTGGKRPEENVEDFQNLIRDFFQSIPPWIMTSSVTNQGRDEILLHMAQLRNYWLKH